MGDGEPPRWGLCALSSKAGVLTTIGDVSEGDPLEALSLVSVGTRV